MHVQRRRVDEWTWSSIALACRRSREGGEAWVTQATRLGAYRARGEEVDGGLSDEIGVVDGRVGACEEGCECGRRRVVREV